MKTYRQILKSVEKWIELGDICKKMNFTEKARSSYHTAAELSQSQGNDERYAQIMSKIDGL